MPDPKVDLVKVAKSVGRSSRMTCGECHFNGGGGEAVKHADMSRQLLDPERSCDVHMGGYDFQCSECHQTRNHKIAGRSTSVPGVRRQFQLRKMPWGAAALRRGPADSPPEQTQPRPLPATRATRRFMPNASRRSFPGTGPRPATRAASPRKDKYGMDDYNWMKGEFVWKESAKPNYTWYNGSMKTRALGRQDRCRCAITSTSPNRWALSRTPGPKSSLFKFMQGTMSGRS